jgi:hypothetical protein
MLSVPPLEANGRQKERWRIFRPGECRIARLSKFVPLPEAARTRDIKLLINGRVAEW